MENNNKQVPTEVITIKKKELSPVFNLEVFKMQLKCFIDFEFHGCDDFFKQLQSTKDTKEIKKLFIKYNEEVKDEIYWECDGECNEARKLERKIEGLENDIEDLKKELEGKTSNLMEEYKLEAFLKHKDKYSLLDFEKLMEKGRVG